MSGEWEVEFGGLGAAMSKLLGGSSVWWVGVGGHPGKRVPTWLFKWLQVSSSVGSWPGSQKRQILEQGDVSA